MKQAPKKIRNNLKNRIHIVHQIPPRRLARAHAAAVDREHQRHQRRVCTSEGCTEFERGRLECPMVAEISTRRVGGAEAGVAVVGAAGGS